jgi:hypothetical protein
MWRSVRYGYGSGWRTEEMAGEVQAACGGKEGECSSGKALAGTRDRALMSLPQY